MDPASSPVFLLGLSTLTLGKSEALGCAECFLRLEEEKEEEEEEEASGDNV